MPSLNDFIKQNTQGPLNKIFLAAYLKDISSADNKWKAVLKSIVDVAFWTTKALAPLRGAFVGAATILGFRQLQDLIRSMVRDSGSLAAALQKLQVGQSLARQLAPFVGGLNAARARVAEIMALAQRGPFTTEQLGGAAVSLNRSTRGSFGGADDVQKIGQVALATGNDVNATAEAVGNFYEALREGRPVTETSEQLRRMGIVSQQTADDLTAMAASGSSNEQVFRELTSALDRTKEGAAGARQELAGITAEHEKARQELAAAFGKSFVEDDIENTKNMTKAWQAITPAVARVGAVFAILFSGFSTAKTKILETVASNAVLRGSFEFVAKAIGVVLVAATALATATLPLLIGTVIRWTATMYAAGGALSALAVGLRILTAASVIGLVISGLVAVGGAIYNYVRSSDEARKKTEEMAASHREAQAAIDAHIASIKSLADQHEAYGAALENVLKLQKELTDLLDNPKSSKSDIIEKTRALRQAEDTLRKGIKEGSAGLASPEAAAVERAAAQRRLQQEQDDFERQLAEHPEQRDEIERRREQLLRGRATTGRIGLEARQGIAESRADLEKQRLGIEANGALLPSERKTQLNAIDQRILALGNQAPAGSSVALQTRAEQLQHALAAREAATAHDTERFFREKALAGPAFEQSFRIARARGPQAIGGEIQRLRVAAELQSRIEEGAGGNLSEANQIAAGRAARARELRVRRTQEDLELRAHEVRRRGNSRQSEQLEDELEFGKQYQANVEAGMSEKEARARALRTTKDRILETANYRGLPQVASALQRIGGGGGVYAPGGDAMLRVAERQRNLLTEIRDYLQKIASNNGGVD